jgi:S-DNA-T family DNA segregation ATPase FtsK/SpoIIIE
MRYWPRRLTLAAFTLLALVVLVGVALLGFHSEDYPASFYPPHDSVQNWLGVPGAVVAGALLPTFGYGAVVPLLLVFTLAVLLLRRSSWVSGIGRLLGWALLVPVTCLLAEWGRGWWPGPTWAGPGGFLGETLAEQVRTQAVVVAILLGTLLLGMQLAARPVPARVLWALFRGSRALAVLFWHELWRSRRAPVVVPVGELEETTETAQAGGLKLTANRTEHLSGTAPAEEEEEEPGDRSIPIHRHEKLAEGQEEVEEKKPAGVLLPDLSNEGGEPCEDYELPPMTLLDEGKPLPKEEHEAHLLETASLLEKTFLDFNLRVKVVGINTGPVITQYEIALETGVRVNRVTALTDDLALNLSVPSVRIVAPIPGKNTVGIEIPNEVREDVRLRDVIVSAQRKAAKMKIPLFIGKDAEGRPLVQDLADMPHLLIAGRTGTGKSVCMNALILSMLMTRRPDEVRLLLIDPKRNEFSEYGRVGLPHLMHPVVVDPKKAEAILGWAVDKMEERYELLARARVRNLAAYNELDYQEILNRVAPSGEDEARKIPRHMPYIVLIIDELADLIMQMRKEVETHIIRLAQKSRAAGIHLIMATQRPTVDVITGLIKSNLPSRICFKVVNRSDSRVVLDEGGGEKLLSRGDMLYMPPGVGTLVRAQGAFAADEEIIRVVEFLDTGEPAYAQELLELKTREEQEREEEAASRGGDITTRDKVYFEAVEVVVREGRGSVSLLQRALGIGYGRAARLIDYMAEDGIVGSYNGQNAREVLLTPEEWAAMRERLQK